MSKKETVNVQGTEISILTHRQDDYISLTDMAKYKNAETTGLIISHWLRTGYSLNFLGAWERLHNSDFNVTEFGNIKMESTDNAFILSTKQWTKRTNAIGIVAKPGRYGGTYAHRDIAFEFATWLSPEFKLYLITEFQRLKSEEQQSHSLEWNLQRTLSKINYRIHTDAIKEEIIPKEVTRTQAAFVYALEADLLNV
ncbi:MAG: KilA-N domain-containing protein, partial [Oscillospiraceae bacterium]|nr:KilA-N domain-containing protein [Oscillospiraceae bacterium]